MFYIIIYSSHIGIDNTIYYTNLVWLSFIFIRATKYIVDKYIHASWAYVPQCLYFQFMKFLM